MLHQNCSTIQKWVYLMLLMIDKYKGQREGALCQHGLSVHGRHHVPDRARDVGDEYGWHSAGEPLWSRLCSDSENDEDRELPVNLLATQQQTIGVCGLGGQQHCQNVVKLLRAGDMPHGAWSELEE